MARDSTLQVVFVFERRSVKGFEELWATMGGERDSLLLVVGEDPEEFVVAAASWRGVSPASVGHILTVEHPDGWKRPAQLLRGHQALIGIDVLFWPSVMADPLRLLRLLSRYGPVIVHWPGEITDGRAKYSEPGRPDYYDEPLAGEVVVRPRPISSPADVLYDLEIAR